jgi:hypothetical protein
MKKLALLLALFVIGLSIGKGVSTISYGPGTGHTGETYYGDGTTYTAPTPETGGTSAASCQTRPNSPFARFVKNFHLSCGPTGGGS